MLYSSMLVFNQSNKDKDFHSFWFKLFDKCLKISHQLVLKYTLFNNILGGTVNEQVLGSDKPEITYI